MSRFRVNRTGEAQPLTLAEIDKRILTRLDIKPEVTNLSQLGASIWPENTMSAQGLALATSKHVARLINAGRVFWSYRKARDWSYRVLVVK